MIFQFIANSYKGCFIEGGLPANRDLSGIFNKNLSPKTIEKCIQYCRTNSFTYAGVQFG